MKLREQSDVGMVTLRVSKSQGIYYYLYSHIIFTEYFIIYKIINRLNITRSLGNKSAVKENGNKN